MRPFRTRAKKRRGVSVESESGDLDNVGKRDDWRDRGGSGNLDNAVKRDDGRDGAGSGYLDNAGKKMNLGQSGSKYRNRGASSECGSFAKGKQWPLWNLGGCRWVPTSMELWTLALQGG